MSEKIAISSELEAYTAGKKYCRESLDCLPTDLSDDLKWSFLRGAFDAYGMINQSSVSVTPKCTYPTFNFAFSDSVINFVGLPASGGIEIIWSGNNALDFMSKLYDGAPKRHYDNHRKYVDWRSCVTGISNNNELKTEWFRNRPDAVPPFKARASDSGYDLVILEKVKQVGDVEFYDTGVSVIPPYGWYFDQVPRSSLSKTGYMLANSIGVIDRTYTGSVIVALRKVNKEASDLELPFRAVQLIPRPIVHLTMVEVAGVGENQTLRAAGGFGSTGR